MTAWDSRSLRSSSIALHGHELLDVAGRHDDAVDQRIGDLVGAVQLDGHRPARPGPTRRTCTRLVAPSPAAISWSNQAVADVDVVGVHDLESTIEPIIRSES